MAKVDLDLFNEFWLRTEREAEFAEFRDNMRKARPFALSDEIDDMVGDLAFANISDRKTARHLASARLPYPVMWIEHGDLGFGRRLPPIIEPMFGTPVRTGWLLEQVDRGADGGMNGFVAQRVSRVPNLDTGELVASIYPLVHHVSTSDYRFDYQRQIDFASAVQKPTGVPYVDDLNEAIRVTAEAHLEPSTPLIGWGGTDDLDKVDMSDETQAKATMRRSPLYGVSSIHLHTGFVNRLRRETFDLRSGVISFMRNAARDQMSELRYLVAALALLNEVPVEYVPYRPSGNVRMGGRLRPFMSSSLVAITVPQSRRRLKDIDRHLQAKGREAIKKARHEVRGHYRHVKKLPKAHPERWERWQDVDGRLGTAGMWWWRTYIEHHLRGSAALGWVEQRYAVLPKSQGHSENDRLTEDRIPSI